MSLVDQARVDDAWVDDAWVVDAWVVDAWVVDAWVVDAWVDEAWVDEAWVDDEIASRFGAGVHDMRTTGLPETTTRFTRTACLAMRVVAYLT